MGLLRPARSPILICVLPAICGDIFPSSLFGVHTASRVIFPFAALCRLRRCTLPSNLNGEKEAPNAEDAAEENSRSVAAAFMMVLYLPAQQAATPAAVVRVGKNTVLQYTLLQPLDPATAKPGDDVPLRLTRPLTVGGLVVLPVGSAVQGTVTKVTPAGRHCTRGAVKWKLETIPLPDGSTVKTEVWRAFSPGSARLPPDTNQHHSADETVGYVIQDAVLLPLALPGLAIDGAKHVVTAPFRQGSCSRWHDLPLPANATVGVRIREDHQLR